MRRSFAFRPCLVVGMPVYRAIFCFADAMPTARFHEKPGIKDFLRRAIFQTPFKIVSDTNFIRRSCDRNTGNISLCRLLPSHPSDQGREPGRNNARRNGNDSDTDKAYYGSPDQISLRGQAGLLLRYL